MQKLLLFGALAFGLNTTFAQQDFGVDKTFFDTRDSTITQSGQVLFINYSKLPLGQSQEIFPGVEVTNNNLVQNSTSVQCDIYFNNNIVYTDQMNVTIDAGITDTVVFITSFEPTLLGEYYVTFTLPNDDNNSNNFATSDICELTQYTMAQDYFDFTDSVGCSPNDPDPLIACIGTNRYQRHGLLYTPKRNQTIYAIDFPLTKTLQPWEIGDMNYFILIYEGNSNQIPTWNSTPGMGFGMQAQLIGEQVTDYNSLSWIHTEIGPNGFALDSTKSYYIEVDAADVLGMGVVNPYYIGSSPTAEYTQNDHYAYIHIWGGTSSCNISAGNYSNNVGDTNHIPAIRLDFEPIILPPSCNGYSVGICSVGSNNLGNNRVVWEKPITAEIDSFFVYRETAQVGVYDLIGAQSYSDSSYFDDVNSNPNVQPYQYKISYLDTCGDLSAQSSEHKTIHLTINQGVGQDWNLIWNHYTGFNYSSYEIYRGTTPSNVTLLNTVPSNVSSYTDQNAPAGNIYYQVVAVNPNGCSPSKAYDFSSSKSNFAATDPLSLSELYTSISVYPNPTNGEVFFNADANAIGSIFSVSDGYGRIVKQSVISHSEEKIDISSWSEGIYYINSPLLSKPIKLIKQ